MYVSPRQRMNAKRIVVVKKAKRRRNRNRSRAWRQHFGTLYYL